MQLLVHSMNPFPERPNVFIYVCVHTYIYVSLTVPLSPACFNAIFTES